MFSTELPLRRRLGVLLAALVTAIAAPLAAGPGARAASVDVAPATVGAPVPNGFLGLSTEVFNLEDYTGDDPRAIDPAFLHLLQSIGPGGSPILRIGGDSTDWSWVPVAGRSKPPGIRYTITPRWLDVAHATARAIHGKLILGVNLEANDRAIAVGEAKAMIDRVGRRYIEAMEIGNEPELYTHFPWYTTASGRAVLGRTHAEWTQDAYHQQFADYAHALPSLPIAGPINGEGVWLDNLGGFLRTEPFVSLTTFHAYPLKHCSASHVIHIPELLRDSTSAGFVRRITPFVAVSHRAGKPIRIDEVNAISCGGTAGVSNSFGSALWMLDTLFGLARTGVDGINVHTRPHSINAILDPIGRGDHFPIAVQPEYYSMMLFARAAPPGARLLRTATSLPPGVEAWATMSAAGTVRVVLINKRPRGAESVDLTVPGATGPASVMRLRARSLAATTDVTLGGQSFGAATATGQLGRPEQTTTVPFGGHYTVGLPAASAAMVTVQPPPATLLVSSLTAALRVTW